MLLESIDLELEKSVRSDEMNSVCISLNTQII